MEPELSKRLADITCRQMRPNQGVVRALAERLCGDMHEANAFVAAVETTPEPEFAVRGHV